jgi:hypothetical protein
MWFTNMTSWEMILAFRRDDGGLGFKPAKKTHRIAMALRLAYFIIAYFGLNALSQQVENWMLISMCFSVLHIILQLLFYRNDYILLGLFRLIPISIIYVLLHCFNILEFNIISTFKTAFFTLTLLFIFQAVRQVIKKPILVQ